MSNIILNQSCPQLENLHGFTRDKMAMCKQSVIKENPDIPHIVKAYNEEKRIEKITFSPDSYVNYLKDHGWEIESVKRA